MVELSMTQTQAPADRQTGKIVLRWVLYIVLVLFALFYLLPLFVMLTTSLKMPRGNPDGRLDRPAP